MRTGLAHRQWQRKGRYPPLVQEDKDEQPFRAGGCLANGARS
jgi:hypothetical protein